MSRGRKKSDFDRAMGQFSVLPWQLFLVLALVAGVAFHWVSQIEPPAPHGAANMFGAIAGSALKTGSLYLQFVAPAVLVMAGFVSWLRQRRRANLLAQTESRVATASLQALTWKEFEQLVGAFFERQGYAVSFTPDGADGGVDVIAEKGRETFLIQCKQWRATKVGVAVVRELFGIMAARGATGAFVVSIGDFTADAHAFAEGRNIRLVDANDLLQDAGKHNFTAATPQPSEPSDSSRLPSCPKCGAPMVKRLARQGANAGRAFLGCSTYPKCRGTRDLG